MSIGIDLAPGNSAGRRLRHPLLVAAGGAGFGAELLEIVGVKAPGALVTRSVTRRPDRGAPPPRMAPLADGLLHAMGTPNPGIDAVLRRQGPRWAAFETPLIVSICGNDVDDIASMARTLEMQPDVSGLELNLACGDRSRGGVPIGLEVETAETATVAARAATDLPLIVKLTAVAPDIRPIARAVVAAGADAVSATTPLPALLPDAARERPRLGAAYGGLSGPALKPTGLRVVYELAQVVKVPIIGIGGVASLDDALDYLAAGASAVGLATAALADPWLPARLAEQLERWCEAQDVTLDQLIGRALPRRRDRGSLRGGSFRR